LRAGLAFARGFDFALAFGLVLALALGRGGFVAPLDFFGALTRGMAGSSIGSCGGIAPGGSISGGTGDGISISSSVSSMNLACGFTLHIPLARAQA
jgi:hypothetical protein